MRISPSFLLSIDICVDDDDDDDFIEFGSQGLDYNAYINTYICLLYTSPSPRDRTRSRMPSSA